jgi:hypothetical protein
MKPIHKNDYLDLFINGRFNYGLLFTFRNTRSPEETHKFLDHFCNLMNREYLGPRWKARSDFWLPMMGFSEREDTNLHIHTVIAVPWDHAEAFIAGAEDCWKNVGRKYGGTFGPRCDAFDYRPLTTSEDRTRFVGYLFKRFHPRRTALYTSPHFQMPDIGFLADNKGRKPAVISYEDQFGGRPGEPVRDI